MQIYNHVVKVQTIPLDVSPIAVQRSCEYLTNISRRLVAVPADAKFNEILSVAYSAFPSPLSFVLADDLAQWKAAR